jgi:hypothetical protein
MEASRPSQSKRRVQAIKSVNAVLFRGNSSVLGFVYVFREARFDVLGQLAALRRYAWSLTRRQVDAEDLVTRRTRARLRKTRNDPVQGAEEERGGSHDKAEGRLS